MQRIVERGQIEAMQHQQVRRIRKPDPTRVFARRGERLRGLSERHSIAGYLRLMAHLANAQQAVLDRLQGDAPASEPGRAAEALPLDPRQILEQQAWRGVLRDLCRAVLEQPDVPEGVRAACTRLADEAIDARARRTNGDKSGWVDAQAEALLGLSTVEIDHAAAPFLMAALQVWWTHLAIQQDVDDFRGEIRPGICPVCAYAPVASVIAADAEAPGYRFLHCALCSSAWHHVRAQCSQCGSAKSISYQSIEGGEKAIRAECCDECNTYRKALYQEHDQNVEPVADDLASLALDLLLGNAGYQRASNNPLFWQA